MRSLRITCDKLHYTLISKEKEFVVPRDSTSSGMLKVLCPYIEKTRAQQDRAEHQLLAQARNAIRLCHFLKEQLDEMGSAEDLKQTVELEEMLQLALEWHCFLQDRIKELDVELPAQFYYEGLSFQ